MRDTAGHVRPGTGALGGQQIGDIIERDDVSLALRHRSFARQLDLVGPIVRAGADLDLVAYLSSTGGLRALDDGRECRYDLADLLADDRDLVPAEHLHGARIE